MSQLANKQIFDYFLVVDFECTCEKDSPADFEHEIIEFPVVLLNSKTMQIEDTLQIYVKPSERPQLSEYCTELTGITQSKVDNAVSLSIALQFVHNWMQKIGLLPSNVQMDKYYTSLHEHSYKRFCFVTDGHYDFKRFLFREADRKGIKVPNYYEHWCDVRKVFSAFYKVPSCSLMNMLQSLQLDFSGRQHSGLDDSKNIAAIVSCLLEDGCVLRINDRISSPAGSSPYSPNSPVMKPSSNGSNGNSSPTPSYSPSCYSPNYLSSSPPKQTLSLFDYCVVKTKSVASPKKTSSKSKSASKSSPSAPSRSRPVKEPGLVCN